MLPRVIVITGPTAAGKTAFSEAVAQHINGVIINADVGQFYTPLTIGTAKPDWKHKSFKCLMFDILDTPKELSSVLYRKKVLQIVTSIVAEKKVPIIVGGSLFYIKSLFFPPQELTASLNQIEKIDLTQPTDVLWNMLKSIDATRALQLHHNDRYRIVRALNVWQQTGIKPSQQKPVFKPAMCALFVSIEPPRNVLKNRIDQRVEEMVQHGFIEESIFLLNTEWELFLKEKKIIGYREIFAWIRAGRRSELLEATKKSIAQKTWQYAKRQLTFLAILKKELGCLEQQVSKTVSVCVLSDENLPPEVLSTIRNFVGAN